MKRDLEAFILKDLDTKLVLLGGPRQAGKTTLAESLYPGKSLTLNYDQKTDVKIIRDASWTRSHELIVFDELHKMKFWKRWIKGLYDTEKRPPRLLVTGSARMDIFKKGGDSLAGRHFSFRLHPLSISEASRASLNLSLEEIEDRMLKFGGFPEPFLNGEEVFVKRWRKSHLDRILREDLLDLEKVRELKSIEILVELLADRVGSTISYSSLAKDLEVSPKSVKHWIEILERMYVIFIVTPYSKNLARALLKEPKIYFYDTGKVKEDPGARLENLVACALLKRNHYLEDTLGDTRMLHYVRDQQKREVDFLTLLDKKPEYLLEVKNSDANLCPHLLYFSQKIPNVKCIQLVKNLRRNMQHGGIHIQKSSEWLSNLES